MEYIVVEYHEFHFFSLSLFSAFTKQIQEYAWKWKIVLFTVRIVVVLLMVKIMIIIIVIVAWILAKIIEHLRPCLTWKCANMYIYTYTRLTLSRELNFFFNRWIHSPCISWNRYTILIKISVNQISVVCRLQAWMDLELHLEASWSRSLFKDLLESLISSSGSWKVDSQIEVEINIFQIQSWQLVATYLRFWLIQSDNDLESL